MRDHPIHHIAERSHWLDAQATGAYRRSTRGLSLDEVGFIHCATADQVRPVLERHYQGVEDLVLLTIAVDRLPDALVYERGAERSELFPHLYGPLPVDAVTHVTDVADLEA